VKKIIIFIVFLYIILSAQNYEISDNAKSSALKLNDLLVNCEFEKAYKLSDELLKKNGDDPLFYYLCLAAIGLKSVDFDEIFDREKFDKIYLKGIEKVDFMLQNEPQNCDLLMIKGFLLSSISAFMLLDAKFASGARTGVKALDALKIAHACDTTNYDAEYYLGFFAYAQAELRRRLGPLGVFTGFPKNSDEGIKSLEKCVKKARFMNRAAEMVLADVYVRENKSDKTAEILFLLLEKYKESRFLLWTKMRYEFAKKDEISAINTAIFAAKLYFRDGGFHNGIMILEEARKMSSSRKFPVEIRRKIAELQSKIDKKKARSSDLKIFDSLIKE
jgi:hypothetical protein